MNERQTITTLIIAVVVGLVCVTVISANRYHSIETRGDVREKSLGHPLLMKNDTDLETVTWQFDKYRSEIASVRKQEAEAELFNKTNNNPQFFKLVVHTMFIDWHPQKGDIELGYRSDGVVVWRVIPEGK